MKLKEERLEKHRKYGMIDRMGKGSEGMSV